MSAETTFEFKAEIKQLLDILVHSLYTNTEIFLRELLSNASDALDKQRFESGARDAGDDRPLEIRIDLDKDAGTLAVSDSGIGMTRDEIIANIGTIAHSGSAEFARRAAEAKGAGLDSLIGRFGVGFYSVYMVADSVEVTTQSFRPGAKAQVWTSDGRGAYTIREAEGEVPRGTRVLLKLKPDLAPQFTDPDLVKEIITRHSNFLSFPILLNGERVNTVPALWREPKFQVTPEQYKEFYSFLTFDEDEPLRTMHIAVDAPVQFNALLFVPSRGNDALGLGREDWGQELYARRVLIQRRNKDVLPEYLSFVQGVVDAEDLPLNISRETLQDNAVIRKIHSTLTKQVLSELDKLAKDDPERYARFWRTHGRLFKAGSTDFVNREKFAALLRFNSSRYEDAEGLVSLEEYAGRVREGQKAVYYAFAPSREAANLSPHLEIFRRKGLEVLYLFEPVDEFVMEALREYKEFKLVAAEHAKAEDLEAFPDAAESKKAKKMTKKDAEALPGLLARIQEILGSRVTTVRASQRLSESPVCLANPDGRVTSSMDKILRVMNRDTSIPQKVLEVNPDHPLVRNLLHVFRENPADPFLELASQQLFESALLLDGYLADPHALVGRMQDLLTRASGWYNARESK